MIALADRRIRSETLPPRGYELICDRSWPTYSVASRQQAVRNELGVGDNEHLAVGHKRNAEFIRHVKSVSSSSLGGVIQFIRQIACVISAENAIIGRTVR